MRALLRASLLPLLIQACAAPSPTVTPAAPQTLDAQGHRGARGLAPENTWMGFETALAIDPAGRALAVGTADGALRVRAVDDDLSPAPVELPERPAPISGLAFTPGGDALISVAGPDGQVERHPVLVDDDALVDALWRATRWCPSTARRVSWIGEAPESAARARARCRARATAR